MPHAVHSAQLSSRRQHNNIISKPTTSTAAHPHRARGIHHAGGRSLDLDMHSSAWAKAAREHAQSVLDYPRPAAAATTPDLLPFAGQAAQACNQATTADLTAYHLSVTYQDEDLEAAAWVPVDRSAMAYSNGGHVFDRADDRQTMVASLTEEALLSHTVASKQAVSSRVYSRFSPSPVVVSVFSFSDVERAAGSDIHADYEMVQQPSPIKSGSWGSVHDFRGHHREPTAVAAATEFNASMQAMNASADVIVAVPMNNAGAVPQAEAPHGSPVELCPLAPWEEQIPKAPVCTPEYKKMAGHLSEWAAVTVLHLVRGPDVNAVFNGRRKEHDSAPSLLVDNIRYCLMSTLLQPSAVFMAIYFICKLPVFADAGYENSAAAERFRHHLFGDDTYPYGSQQRQELELYAAFKVFVNGILLASKMLDDATFSNKVWHEISRVPREDINALEMASLDLLSYDLTVPAEEWTLWLEVLRNNHASRAPYPAPIGPARETPHGAILRMLDDLLQANTSRPHNAIDGPVFLGIEERITQRLKVLDVWFNVVDDDLDEDGPLRDKYHLRPHFGPVMSPLRVTKDAPPNLPPPAEWFPEADPIVARPQRSTRTVWPESTAAHMYQQQPIFHISAAIGYPTASGYAYATAYQGPLEPTYHHQPAYHHQFTFYQTPCCT